jgi:hypothetical protein
MKQYMIVAIAMLAVIAFAAPIFADTAASSTVNVSVQVNPNVSLRPLFLNVNAGTVQTGPVTAFCQFEVDANSEQVSFQVNASNLYKGDDPTTSIFIPLNLSAPVLVQPVNGNAILPHSNYLCYAEGVGLSVGGFYTFSTEIVGFESSQPGVFSQEVDVTVTWLQGNAELPQGQYSGVVQLVATLLPTD